MCTNWGVGMVSPLNDLGFWIWDFGLIALKFLLVPELLAFGQLRVGPELQLIAGAFVVAFQDGSKSLEPVLPQLAALKDPPVLAPPLTAPKYSAMPTNPAALVRAS